MHLSRRSALECYAIEDELSLRRASHSNRSVVRPLSEILLENTLRSLFQARIPSNLPLDLVDYILDMMENQRLILDDNFESFCLQRSVLDFSATSPLLNCRLIEGLNYNPLISYDYNCLMLMIRALPNHEYKFREFRLQSSSRSIFTYLFA